ncbi:MAG: helix-turn-helix transcriptional regulator [Bacteroidales bacterium]|nr:helix-turn-helix transcriptional regulator [Bacteroidales bacterium]
MTTQKRFPTALVSGDYRASSLTLDGGSIIDQCIVTAGEHGTFFLEQHLLYVVLGGKVRLSHGQQQWTVGKNEMILLRKCQSVDYEKSSDPATGLFESLLFGISSELLKEFLASQNVGPVATTEEQGARVCPMSERLVAYCRSLQPYFDQPGRAEPALLRLKMMELLFDVMDCSKITFRQMLQLRTPMRSDLRRVVEANITTPIGIDELAYLSGRSRSSFKREFQATYGEPPARWMREQRLLRAYAMLSGSSLPVSEVAYSLGFENASHFSRLFKRRFGVPPSSLP